MEHAGPPGPPPEGSVAGQARLALRRLGWSIPVIAVLTLSASLLPVLMDPLRIEGPSGDVSSSGEVVLVLAGVAVRILALLALLAVALVAFLIWCNAVALAIWSLLHLALLGLITVLRPVAPRPAATLTRWLARLAATPRERRGRLAATLARARATAVPRRDVKFDGEGE
jgi:hypothetical protein